MTEPNKPNVNELKQKEYRFLVVDDDEPVRRLLTKMLAGEPAWKVHACASVSEALAEIQAHPHRYDVIFTDLNMPDQDGFDFLDALDRLDASIIRVVVTGHATTQNAIQSLRRRALDIVEKPFDATTLRAAAARALAERAARQREMKYRAELELTCTRQMRDLQKTVRELRATQLLLVEKFAAMVDMREHQTGMHSKRVALMFDVMAKAAGLTPSEIETMRYGALLHDVGKIAVPDAILLKPEPLTPAERKAINRHVDFAAELLSDIPFLAGALDVVLHHHERYDGQGYPKGLRGGEIPLGARIFAVIDSYEAIRSDRCYSKAVPPPAARAEIEKNAGTQFDPAIVKIFIKCLPEIDAAFEQ